MTAHDFPVRQAEDRLPARRVAVIAALAILIGCLCVIVSWLLGRSSANASITRGVAFVAPAPQGTVERALTVEQRGADRVAAQRRRLASYGWVDRERGLAHIPIERAIELEAEHAR